MNETLPGTSRSSGVRTLPRPSNQMEAKMDCIQNLLSMLTLSPDNNTELSKTMLEMSRYHENCISMRQSGCIALLVQMIHSNNSREVKNRAAQALHNLVHTRIDDKASRREARVWRLLEQVREYCYYLEDLIIMRNENKIIDDDMTKHPSQSVAALMKLSFDEEHRHVVCLLGGLQVLSQLVTVDQLAHESQIEDPTCMTLRKYAGMTLTNLTFGDGNNKSLLCSFKDFMTALVEQLESKNDDMRQVTSAVLRNLSWRADSNSKQVLREVGAVKGLTLAAMNCQKEATLKSVLSALWNLTAHCSANKVSLCSVDGALGFLVDMLSFNSPNKTLAIIENAGGIMRNVSSHIAVREDYRRILRERNCLSVLLFHLKSPSLTVVSNACGTLWNLSARCPQDQEFLWDHGAVPMLQSLMHSKHKMIAMGSSAALKNLLNSRPGKSNILTFDTTAKIMNLPALPTLGVRKQKALEQEIDQNLAETCDNIEPANSPTTLNNAEKHLLSATERQIAMNLARHRMTSSSPLMSTLSSQNSFNHTPHSVSLSNTLMKSCYYSQTTDNSPIYVNRSDSKDSVTSVHSDSILERASGKTPIPTPRSLKLPPKKQLSDDHENYVNLSKFKKQPPVPPPRISSELTKPYSIVQVSSKQVVDYSQKYLDAHHEIASIIEPQISEDFDKSQDEEVPKNFAKEDTESYGDYQETDLDQPTDYSLKYAENGSEHFDQPVAQDDTIKTFCTEGTPYETPIIFSTATSMTDLRGVGKQDNKKLPKGSAKINCEISVEPDEKDSCSLEQHNNDTAVEKDNAEKFTPTNTNGSAFDSKTSSGMISPEKPVNYCDEGTPGYFSRVSSLSSLEEGVEGCSLVLKENSSTALDHNTDVNVKEKEASKSVTFASEEATTCNTDGPNTPANVEDTPLMFSRSSSLGSIPGSSGNEFVDDHASVQSEISQLASGLISPSEIPDSPGAPLSPRHHPRESGKVFPTGWSGGTSCLSPLTVEDGNNQNESSKQHWMRSNFKEEELDENSSESSHKIENAKDAAILRDSFKTYCTEDTPALLSKVGSNSNLSTLSIETDHEPSKTTVTFSHDTRNASDTCHVYVTEDTPAVLSKVGSASNLSALSIELESDVHEKSTVTFDEKTADNEESCKVFFTEDTPAVMSKVGSNSNLSVLSIETDAQEKCDSKKHDSSTDSSNLSDSGENVLAECIEMGIAKVVKNPQSKKSYDDRGHNFKSLPPYLEATYENIGFDREATKSVPPVPKRGIRHTPPPLPPRTAISPLGSDDERIFNMAIQKGISQLKDRKKATNDTLNSSTPIKCNFDRNDSLSSLSVDSYGSTDREIFEQCVRAGLDVSRHKSLERPRQAHRMMRINRSLDRKPKSDSDSYSNDSFGSTDREVFEKSVKAGMSKQMPKNVITPPAVVAPEAAGGEDVAEFGFDKLPTCADMSALDDCDDDSLDGSVASRMKKSDTSSTLCDMNVKESRVNNRSENNLPDLLGESSSLAAKSIPDLMNDVDSDGNKHISITSIEKEAAQLAVKLKHKSLADCMTASQNSNLSLELEHVKPPSNMGSLLSLSQSLCNEDCSITSVCKKDSRGLKKPKPLSMILRGRLAHSLTSRGSSENIDSLIDNVNPPSEMDDIIDLENCATSTESISSENDISKCKLCPVDFDFKEPVNEKFINTCKVYANIEEINPPSLFDELIETNLEFDRYIDSKRDDEPSLSYVSRTAEEDSDFNVKKPKQQLTAKQKRQAAKHRYQTYVIKNFSCEGDDEPSNETEAWQIDQEISESENNCNSDVTTSSVENKSKRKLNAKQRRSTDRERYQTQVVNLSDINDSIARDPEEGTSFIRKTDSKKTMKQRRLENAERYKTRTIVDEIVSSSPNDSFKDVNLDNADTTTGYDSLSSLELNHQLLHEEHTLDITPPLNSSYMLSFTNLNKVTISTVEAKNRYNIELNNSYHMEDNKELDYEKKTATFTKKSHDFKTIKTLDVDNLNTDSEPELLPTKAKPKIVKPTKISSFDTRETEEKPSKGIRGRSKAPYVSPYRQNSAPAKSQTNKPATQKIKSDLNDFKQSKTVSKSPSKNLANTPSTSKSNVPMVRQGTFVKEESSVFQKNIPNIEAKNVPNGVNSPKKTKTISTRLPQASKPQPSNIPKTNRPTFPKAPISPNKNQSSQSLSSNDSSKKPQSKAVKDATSRIATLWKKVETTKKQQSLECKVFPADKKPSKLIRSSTFENPPKGDKNNTQMSKQKSSIGTRDTQIPSAKYGKTTYTFASRSSALKLYNKKSKNDEIL